MPPRYHYYIASNVKMSSFLVTTAKGAGFLINIGACTIGCLLGSARVRSIKVT
jgi:hypothetical protein